MKVSRGVLAQAENPRINVLSSSQVRAAFYSCPEDIEITTGFKKNVYIVAIDIVVMALIKKYHSLRTGMIAESGQRWKHGGSGGGGGRGMWPLRSYSF